jgi:hypothetical protein
VSRLYDRVMAVGCSPLSGQELYDGTIQSEANQQESRRTAELILGRPPTDADVADVQARVRQALQGAVSTNVLARHQFDDAVVISAEEVADYIATFRDGADLTDIFDRVAPPFPRMFVEFQQRPNALNLDSWGILIYGEPYLLALERLAEVFPARVADRLDEDGDGWVLVGAIVGEWRKGHPVGPLGHFIEMLDPGGYLRPMEDWPGRLRAEMTRADQGKTMGFFAANIPDLPEDFLSHDFAINCGALINPATFAISLFHCKNVSLRAVDPPERLSKKHAKKTGHPLTRYHVLEIEPMRRILDTEGEAQTKGLAHALHICRGHFKTYTEGSPLFGKQVGTYWWASQVRGKAEHGVVEKDYRVRLDQGLGREYRSADEHAEIAPNAPEHTGLDPDLGGRGLRAHNIAQNLLAAAVEEAGYEPRRPNPDEPQYDLAWEAGDVTWVAEVKSITPQNEERQLRHALGQVLRYRQLLEADGRTVKALIAIEREPSDTSWAELCAGERIALVWPSITLPA